MACARAAVAAARECTVVASQWPCAMWFWSVMLVLWSAGREGMYGAAFWRTWNCAGGNGSIPEPSVRRRCSKVRSRSRTACCNRFATGASMVSGAGRVLGFHGGRVAVGAVTTEHLGAGGGGGLGRRIVLCEVVVPARAAGGAAEVGGEGGRKREALSGECGCAGHAGWTGVGMVAGESVGK